MDLPTLERLITTIGFPGAALIFLAWGIVVIVRWTAREFVKPLVERWVVFADALELNINKMASSITEISASQKAANEAIKGLVCRYPLNQIQIHKPKE